MTTIEKFRQLIKEKEFKEKLEAQTKFAEAYINAISDLLELKKTTYSLVNFEKILSFLELLDLSEDEKTEVIAYYINKCLNIYTSSLENETIYLNKIIGANKKRYDLLCKNVSKLRNAISETGEILPYNSSIGVTEVALFQLYVPIEDKYIKAILNLCKKRYKILFKEQQRLNKACRELISLMDKINNGQNKISADEIEIAKKNMIILNYSEEKIKNILAEIEKTNSILLISQAMKPEKSLEDSIIEYNNENKEINYKEQKKLAYELGQYIDLKSNKPYDYLDEDEVTEVSNLLNLLGYPLERVYIILNNIKKRNANENKKDSDTELFLKKQEIFAEIDEREDKPFEALASDIFSNALQNETMLEDMNIKINNAICDIQEAINNIINCSSEEDYNLWISYIMELLNDIDQLFEQAWSWNLVRARREDK